MKTVQDEQLRFIQIACELNQEMYKNMEMMLINFIIQLMDIQIYSNLVMLFFGDLKWITENLLKKKMIMRILKIT